jgi:hypothetical protein
MAARKKYARDEKQIPTGTLADRIESSENPSGKQKEQSKKPMKSWAASRTRPSICGEVTPKLVTSHCGRVRPVNVGIVQSEATNGVCFQVHLAGSGTFLCAMREDDSAREK